MPDSLYIHIPFCIRKCIYCDFFSVPYDKSAAQAYIGALCRELMLKKDSAQALKTVYIGGGTPSLLPDKCLKQLFICLKDNFSFSPDIEITIEANPGTINESKINTLFSLGINRLSIGIQSFNDNELKVLGRIHSSEDALISIEMIKNAGINNFSVDLMYGIPGQTMESWKDSLLKASGGSPKHISTYELTPEENTPLYELLKSNPPSPPLVKRGRGGFFERFEMPEEDLILEMYNHTIDYLGGCGYKQYEISNFAMPGFECMHNLNYWDRGGYIGTGAGAHSFINEIRSMNTKDIKNYIETLTEGKSVEMESIRLFPLEALKEFIFLGLRKIEGININKTPLIIPTLTRVDTGGYNRLLDASKELITEGYLEFDRGYLRLTRKGLVISNTVIVKLFEKLGL
jgi:oxygen-independent coproporphyrinogen-3 oxidase